MKPSFESADPYNLTARQSTAINDLLTERTLFLLPNRDIHLPQKVEEIPFLGNSLLLLAWSSSTRISAILVGYWNPDNDPALAVFEGAAPFVASLAYFSPCNSIADTSNPGETIRETFPEADRITIHVPAGDAMTATALGRLGFTLDSYMDISSRFASQDLPHGLASGFKIRPATAADAGAIVALHELHVRDQVGTSAFVAEPAGTMLFTDDVVSRIADGGLLHVAVSDSEVLGVVEAACRDVPADGKVRRIPCGRAGVIEWVSMATRCRRRGIGSALVASALGELQKMRAEYVYVFRGANNPLSGPGFWRKFGFCPAWGTWEMAVDEAR